MSYREIASDINLPCTRSSPVIIRRAKLSRGLLFNARARSTTKLYKITRSFVVTCNSSRARFQRFSLRLSFDCAELSWLSQFDLFTVFVWAGFTCATVVVKLESQVQSGSFSQTTEFLKHSAALSLFLSSSPSPFLFPPLSLVCL